LKLNSFKIISELLLSGNPNADMLIIKPVLYTYIKKDNLDTIKQNGLPSDENGLIKAYFTRVPESLDSYTQFLSDHVPLKIMISKLKHIDGQKIKINPVNIPNMTAPLNEEDIKKIAKRNNFFYNWFKDGKDISQIPQATIWVEKRVLPAFCFKTILPIENWGFMRYFGLDIATTSGWVFLEEDRLIEKGTIQLLSQMDLPQKLYYFRLELKNILERLKPEWIFVEDVFLGISGARTLSYLSRLNGREQYVIKEKHLKDSSASYEDLAKILKISRERVSKYLSEGIDILQETDMIIPQKKIKKISDFM